MGSLASVNVGRGRQIAISRRGRPVISAIGKSAVAGRVAVRGVNLAGDEQADGRVHGGPDKAIYAYASEDTAWWSSVLGRELGPGAFGENLTTIGVEVSAAVIGERWRIGSSELEVCQPRLPCYKLGIAFGDDGMVRRFAHAGRPGAYLRTIKKGELGAGDQVENHGIAIETVARAMVSDGGVVAIASGAPALPPALAAWMRERAGITARGT
jgi:MOSC domain-containing protein YiiM